MASDFSSCVKPESFSGSRWAAWMVGILGLGLILPSLGCNFGAPQPDYSELGLVEISGTVTLDGTPVENAAVFFHDRPNRRYSWGVTDANGKYRLMFDSRKSGVMPGQKEVEITTTKNPGADPTEADGEGLDGEGGEGEPSSPTRTEKIPSRYNKNTELTWVVSESRDDVDFELVSDGKSN